MLLNEIFYYVKITVSIYNYNIVNCVAQRGVFDTAQVSNNENNRFTKDCIYEALWELLKQYPYNTITITQIANKAGVSRNAIYRNFESKDLIIKNDCWKYTMSLFVL